MNLHAESAEGDSCEGAATLPCQDGGDDRDFESEGQHLRKAIEPSSLTSAWGVGCWRERRWREGGMYEGKEQGPTNGRKEGWLAGWRERERDEGGPFGETEEGSGREGEREEGREVGRKRAALVYGVIPVRACRTVVESRVPTARVPRSITRVKTAGRTPKLNTRLTTNLTTLLTAHLTTQRD